MMLDFISTYDCIVDGKYSININKNLYDVYCDFEFAKSKNIDLYVLIAADKYDVYQEDIIDNQYPPKTLLKELEQHYQHPNLIISRDTLYDMVQNNILDVFWANDTHWSPVGAEAVAEQILKYID